MSSSVHDVQINCYVMTNGSEGCEDGTYYDYDYEHLFADAK